MLLCLPPPSAPCSGCSELVNFLNTVTVIEAVVSIENGPPDFGDIDPAQVCICRCDGDVMGELPCIRGTEGGGDLALAVDLIVARCGVRACEGPDSWLWVCGWGAGVRWCRSGSNFVEGGGGLVEYDWDICGWYSMNVSNWKEYAA